MMLPLFVAVIYKEYNSVVAFTIACAISFGLGIITTSILGRSSSTEALRYTDSYFIVSFAWIMSSVLAAIPFVIQGSIPNVIDAFLRCVPAFQPLEQLYLQMLRPCQNQCYYGAQRPNGLEEWELSF